jgi:hypothetical protein
VCRNSIIWIPSFLLFDMRLWRHQNTEFDEVCTKNWRFWVFRSGQE